MAIFFIKDTPFEFWFCTGKCSQTSKLVQFGPIGRHPHLSKTARIVGPLIWVSKFFHKTDPLLILFLCEIMLKKFLIGQFLADRQTPHFSKRPANGASNTWVGDFLHKTDPLWIWILCRKLFKIFQIGWLWADWQTPQYVQNGPQYGAQNTRVGIFFIKLSPFQFGFCTIYDWKIFKLVHFGPIGRPPISPNRLQFGAPNNELAIFFHKNWSLLNLG